MKSGLRNPPGPSPSIFGHYTGFVRDPLGFLADCAAEYGDVTAFRLPGVRFMLLTDPANIGRVFSETNSTYINHGGMRLPLSRKLFGTGLLTSEGKAWERQRHTALPYLRPSSVDNFVHTMIRETRRTLDELSAGMTVDALEITTRLAMRVFTNTLVLTEVAGKESIIESFLTLKNGFRLRHRFQTLGLLFSLPVGIRDRRAVSTIDRVVRTIIDERRATQRIENDLLAAMIGAKDENGRSVSEAQIESEIKTFFFTGVFGAALPLAWTLHLIAGEAEVQSRLAAEGSEASTCSDGPSFVREAGYSRNVLKETLRLYPPIWASGREALVDTDVGGYFVPAGTQMVLSQWVTHRDPRFWTEPDRFDPGRWGPEMTFPKYAYFPHGGGPRYCMGESFAESLAAVLLSMLCERFRIERVTENPGVVASYALFPRQRILLKLSSAR